MIKIFVRIFAGLISVSALGAAVILIVNIVNDGATEDFDLWFAVISLLAVTTLFMFVLFNRYHKSVISFLAWLVVIVLIGHGYDAYDRGFFQYGVEAYFILLLFAIGFVLLGFLRPASWQNQFLIFIASVGCLFAYYQWYEHYQIAGKQIKKLEKRTAIFSEKLSGNGCYPPLSKLTIAQLEPKLVELKKLDEQLRKHLPSSQMSTKLFADIKENAKKQNVEILEFMLASTRNIEFYSETKFSMILRVTQSKYTRFVDKYLNGEQLILWQDVPGDNPNTMFISGTIYGYLDGNNRNRRDVNGYCSVESSRIWMPPYTSLIETAQSAFLKKCHQAEKYKDILDKQRKIATLTRHVLSRADIVLILAKETRNERLKKMKINMPVPCL